jgi:hypothetical protein
LFKVLLRDTASDWMVSLPAEQSDTLEHFTTAFKERFHDNEAIKYKSARDLFFTKQLETQTVDEFVTQLLKIARKIGQDRNADITRYAILSGLKPQIASQVVMSNPGNTDQVIERARLAEVAAGSASNRTDSGGVNKSVAQEIQEQQVRQLTDDLASLKLKVAEMKSTNVIRTSPSPNRGRRVSFQTDGRRSTTPPLTRNGTRQQSRRQPFRSQFNGRGHQLYNQPNNMSSRRQQPQAPSYMRNAAFPRYQQHNGVRCYYCSKFGHMARFCRNRLANVAQNFSNPRQNPRRQF